MSTLVTDHTATDPHGHLDPTEVAEFIHTIRTIAAGASVVDASLVQELVRALRRRDPLDALRRRDPLDALSPREREVLALMAEGASNAGIAARIYVSEGTVEKHVRSILMKLDLPESESGHRRVLAVLRFLETRWIDGVRSTQLFPPSTSMIA
jgi:DNA-binding NarL/FixJ family response regulator